MDVLELQTRLDEKKSLLAEYIKAEKQVLVSQEYKIGSRTMTRADLKAIQAERKTLENEVRQMEAQLTGRGKRASFRVTLRDL